MTSRARTLALCSSLVLLIAAVYARALFVGFYSDDYEMLARMAPTLARPDFVFSVFYRDFDPVLHVSFLADYLVGGGEARVYHLTSIAAHAGVVVLVFLLALGLGASRGVAFMAAAVWGVGVRISEPVIWPVARGHLLAALFPLAAIVWIQWARTARLPVATALLVAGLFSKESALFPMLLTPLFVEDRVLRPRLIAIVAVAATAFVALNFAIKTDFDLPGEGVWAAIQRLPFVVMRPLGLGDLYDFGALGFAVFVAVSAMIAVLARRSQAWLGILWVLFCTLPILPLQKVSPRYLYLLSVGFPLAFAGCASDPALQRLTTSGRRALAVALGAGAVMLVVANAIFVQREIDDYRIMGGPYARCLDALTPAALGLPAGGVLTVIETTPHTAIRDLVHTLSERGTMNKLVPERQGAVSGLIKLSDAINIARGRGTMFAVAAQPVAGEPQTIVRWDGQRIEPAPPAAEGRALSARLVPASEYVRAARSAR